MLFIRGKKSEFKKLQKQYSRLLKEAHSLSIMDRAASDKKIAEAYAVMQRLEKLSIKQ